MDLLQRYRGAMVGVHVGDSIGAPYETWDPKRIAKDLKERGGLTFFDYPNPWADDGNGVLLPIGKPTDDSDQTADLAYSLIACDGLDPKHLRIALADSVVRKQSRLWSGKSNSAGKTTRDALCDDPKRNERARNNNIGTNGSLMRATPMALLFPNMASSNPESEFMRSIYAMSNVTHTHPHSKQACLIYCLVMSELLRGVEKEAVFDVVLDNLDMEIHLYDRVISALFDNDYTVYDPGAWPMRGAAEFSLLVALRAFKETTSFASGIEYAVRIGGDTDTYAAIAGGLLGAYYGYEAIPEDWRKAILGHDAMVKYADGLYDMSQR